MAVAAREMKRYNLSLPADLFNELQEAADNRQTTVVDILRRFIKLGLLVVHAEDDPNSSFIIRQGDVEKEIMLL